MALSPKNVEIDGRRLRSERTRQYIIEAYLVLLRESPRLPTAAQIAERAGYSVRSLFERFPDRFLVGSDTWVNERWASYGEIMAGYRNWLAQLPPDVAAKIAHGNAREILVVGGGNNG